MQLFLLFLISINDIPIISGEGSSYDSYITLQDNSTTTMITTSNTPCLSLFSFAYQIISGVLSGNANNTTETLCNESNILSPSYLLVISIIILINEWNRIYKL
jgi:hypothetical protein